MNEQNFVDVGYSNFVSVDKILTINNYDSAPIRRAIQMAKDNGSYLDLTQGKKTRSILTLKSESGIIFVASYVMAQTISERIKRLREKQ